MIEISECSKGSKRLLEFKRIVRLCHHLPVNVNVHWEINTDEIAVEFPNGHKVSSTLFEGLSDHVAIRWLYVLYMLGGEKNDIKMRSMWQNFFAWYK